MNNKFFILTAFLLVFCRLTYAQSDSAKMAGQIIKLEQQLADALPVDSALWSKYTDPKWYIMSEDGDIAFKKEFLESFKPFPKVITIHADVTKPVFAFHDNIAVIQYVADEHEIAYGQKLHTTYGTMDVWYKTDTSWRMLSMQNFEIPALPPSFKVDQKILATYVGRYRLDADNIAKLSIKNDSLYIQKNKKTPEALYPETVNVFFKKSDARGRKIFVKDESGNWQMLERRNGQDLVWKRIN